MNDSAMVQWLRMSSAIPANGGQGPPVPIVLLLTAQDLPYDLADLSLPTDKDIFFEVVGGGGGGANGAASPGHAGGGGAAGAYQSGTVSAILRSGGGSVLVGRGGAGGASGGHNGENGFESSLTLNGVPALFAGQGLGGSRFGLSVPGGSASPIGLLPDEFSVQGGAGAAAVDPDGGDGGSRLGPDAATGGSGGISGGAPATDGSGPGAGGGGEVVGGGAGGDGQDGFARLTWWP